MLTIETQHIRVSYHLNWYRQYSQSVERAVDASVILGSRRSVAVTNRAVRGESVACRCTTRIRLDFASASRYWGRLPYEYCHRTRLRRKGDSLEDAKAGRIPVTDQWMIRGTEFTNCNCAWGCPCQFGAKTTHGHCETVMCGHIEEGNFNDTNLDGLDWAVLMYWPGEVAQGNGTQQVVIEERSDPAQREGLRKILHGESTVPGVTHFFVYNSTMSTVLDTLYAPIELTIDVEQRIASLKVDGLVESHGTPIISPYTGEPSRSRINMPDGIHYIFAEMGNGSTVARAGIELDLKDSYGQVNVLHVNQNGMIR
jgi:hypothetical protein